MLSTGNAKQMSSVFQGCSSLFWGSILQEGKTYSLLPNTCTVILTVFLREIVQPALVYDIMEIFVWFAEQQGT